VVTAEEVQAAFDRGRRFRQALVAAEAKMNPPPQSPWAAFGSMVLKGLTSKPMANVLNEQLEKAITDLRDRRQHRLDEGEELASQSPQLPIVPSPAVPVPGTRAKPDSRSEISGFVGTVDEAKPVLLQ